MSIEAHKCNVQGCQGFVVFENADFDLKDIPLNDDLGAYAFDDPTCNECGKKYYVIPYYIVIDMIDKELGDYEQLNSACMTAVERRKKEIKYEAETDPSLRIMNFLIQRNYTYSVSDVIAEYSRYQEQKCYVSHSMKDCFDNLENEIKSLLGVD